MTYLLPILVGLPVIASVIATLAGPDSATQRRLGVVMALAIAVCSLGLFSDTVPAFSVAWFNLWGTGAEVHFSLANDGLRTWLVQLVTWLTPFALLAAAGAAKERMRSFVVAVLAMEALMIGALLASDLVLFVLCYEGMLIPMVALIALFGGYERNKAAMSFFVFTMAASIFLLIATWWLAAQIGSTDINALSAGVSTLSSEARSWLFWAFVLAFAVKIPLIPLHGWQALTYENTPGAAVALLAGAMAKIGIYGVLRLVLPVFPNECVDHATLFIVLGLIATVGGALAAIVQDNAKAMIAYSSLSHLGLVVVGIFTFQSIAMHGVAVQMVAHGLSVAALFMLMGYLENRTGMFGLDDFGTLAGNTPRLAVLFVVAALATAGMPATANFVGEFLLLMGIFQGAGIWVAGIAGLSVILTVVYLLILIQRWFFGSHEPASREPITDLSAVEICAVGPLLIASFVIGCWATPVIASAGKVADDLAAPARALLSPVKPTTREAVIAPAVAPAAPITPVTAPEPGSTAPALRPSAPVASATAAIVP